MSTDKHSENDDPFGIGISSGSSFTFDPDPNGSFIKTSPPSNSYAVSDFTPPPSSLAQFIALDVVIGFGRPDEHTAQFLFNLEQITHFGGPDEASPGYFTVETAMDEHVIRGDWDNFKAKLKTIATLWD